jgi:hypothetical protein
VRAERASRWRFKKPVTDYSDNIQDQDVEIETALARLNPRQRRIAIILGGDGLSTMAHGTERRRFEKPLDSDDRFAQTPRLLK